MTAGSDSQISRGNAAPTGTGTAEVEMSRLSGGEGPDTETGGDGGADQQNNDRDTSPGGQEGVNDKRQAKKKEGEAEQQQQQQQQQQSPPSSPSSPSSSSSSNPDLWRWPVLILWALALLASPMITIVCVLMLLWRPADVGVPFLLTLDLLVCLFSFYWWCCSKHLAKVRAVEEEEGGKEKGGEETKQPQQGPASRVNAQKEDKAEGGQGETDSGKAGTEKHNDSQNWCADVDDHHDHLAWFRSGRSTCILVWCFVCGVLIVLGGLLALFVPGEPQVQLTEDYDASLPVAVIGCGASGLTATWMLSQGGRSVVCYEANSILGGHSYTYKGRDLEGNDLVVDLGYIFNNEQYYQYKAFVDHFGIARQESALNTSGAFNGQYWDNGAGSYKDEALNAEIERFLEFSSRPSGLATTIMPLGMFLRVNGFSDDFINRALVPCLTVLFVTKKGLMKQSTGGVFSYFQKYGFTHFHYDDPDFGGAKVEFTPGGSQQLWQAVIRDILYHANTSAAAATTALQTNHHASRVFKERDGTWTVEFENGRTVGGYGDVVMATPAEKSVEILDVPDQSLRMSFLRTIEYSGEYLTLHNDRAVLEPFGDSRESDDILYFVEVADEGNGEARQLSGRIGKIFGWANSSIVLTVHSDKDLVAEDKVVKQFFWSHHLFSLWEIITARYFLPYFWGRGNLHLAGDYAGGGVGHNDAILAGVRGACMAGITREPANSSNADLYREFLSVCSISEDDEEQVDDVNCTEFYVNATVGNGTNMTILQPISLEMALAIQNSSNTSTLNATERLYTLCFPDATNTTNATNGSTL